MHSTEAFTTAREDLGLLVVNKGSKERKKKTDRDGWPLTSMEEFVVFAYKIKKEPKSVGYTKMLRIVRKSNLYIYNKHLTDIVCTIPLSTDSQLYLYVWQPRSENVPYFGYSLLDYLQLLYVCLAEYFSKNILVSKSFAKKFGLWNIKKDSFASFFFVWSILNSQWAFYANGPHTKRILQQGGKFIAGVPFNFLLKNSSVCYFGHFQCNCVYIYGIFE